MSIIKFLCGESEFGGFWFGDKPGNEGAFWWRKHLREYDDARTKELASLKKLYNDLLESHESLQQNFNRLSEIEAGNNITINDFEESNAKHIILNKNQSETIGNLYNQIDEIKKESREWQLLSEHFKAANQVEILESELLKAKERIAELEDENKTLSQFDER
jgi:hypothetical protein